MIPAGHPDVRTTIDTFLCDPEQIKDFCENPDRMFIDLSTTTEYVFRSGVIRGYLIGKGLAKQMDDILCNLNKVVMVRDPPFEGIDPENFSNLDELKKALVNRQRCDNASVLAYAMRYIDRWEMYHELLSQ